MIGKAAVADVVLLVDEPRKEAVVGPYGERLTRDMLPPRDTRWTARRKGEVVAIVRGGAMLAEEVCGYYGITMQEFRSWDEALGKAGLKALRVTRSQYYKRKMALFA